MNCTIREVAPNKIDCRLDGYSSNENSKPLSLTCDEVTAPELHEIFYLSSVTPTITAINNDPF